jgi:HAD superfamily hydrolase (TIGR01509 family)
VSGNFENTRGVIFDMDGVISDTQNLHSLAESEFLSSLGIQIHPDEITARFAGVGDHKMFTTIFAEHKISHPIEKIVQQKWNRMADLVNEVGIKAVPYVIDLIEQLYGNGFRLAIASGSPRSFINNVVEKLALQKYFSATVSSEEVPHGKPAPDVFLEAARRAHISTTECVIIEDGISGMQAAARANIPCIGLVTNADKDYPATLVVQSLKDVTIEMVLHLQQKQVIKPGV